MNARVMDLLTPIGKGQRGLIVSPPTARNAIIPHSGKVLSQLSGVKAMELPVEKLSKTKTNEDFLGP